MLPLGIAQAMSAPPPLLSLSGLPDERRRRGKHGSQLVGATALAATLIAAGCAIRLAPSRLSSIYPPLLAGRCWRYQSQNGVEGAGA